MAKKAYVGVGGVARKIKKGYVGVSETYEVLEYIQSTGTQCIDLAFYARHNSRVVLDVSDVPNSAQYLFGGRNVTGPSASLQFGVYRSTATTLRCDYFGENKSTTLNSSLERTLVDMNANVLNAWGTTITMTVKSGTCTDSLYLLAVNTAGKAEAFTSAKVYSCQAYINGTDTVPTKNVVGVRRRSDGEVGMYDRVNNVYHRNVGTGAFIAGPATGEVINAPSAARQIKKGYVGIGGVARPFWSNGELVYYGAVTALSAAKSKLAATSVGDYALFAGGEGIGYVAGVDAYNRSLTKSMPTALSAARSRLAAATIGDYALFAGGATGYVVSNVDAYNKSLTRSTATALRSGRPSLAAATVGDYAIFAGGENSVKTVDAYNKSLTQSAATSLSAARYDLAATTVGDYALFAGGYNGGYVATVEAYNKSLTKSTQSSLTTNAYRLAATSVGDYALFAGGANSGVSASVTAYNKSLTRSTATSLSVGRAGLAAATIGDYALFAGGVNSNVIDIYDASLTRRTVTSLSVARAFLAAATVGNYALFAGGINISGDYQSVVDAYALV